MFVKRTPHRIVVVKDTDGDSRKVCKCQVKEKHMTDDGKVEFPVYECPKMTERFGVGTEEGLQKI